MSVEGIGMLAAQIAGGDRRQGLVVQALELNRKLCLSEKYYGRYQSERAII